MKRVFLFFTLVLFTAGVVQSQGFFLRAGAGGGIGTSSDFNTLYKYKTNGTMETVEVVPLNLGSGFNGGIAFGYMFKKYLGIELMMNGFWGLNTLGDSLVNIPGAETAEIKVSGSLISMIPSIVITAGLDKVNPYARFGFLIGVWPGITADHVYNDPSYNPPQTAESMVHYFGGMSLGYAATGGVDFRLNDIICLYVELSFMHSTWSPSYSEIIKYEVGGVDQLPTLSEKEKKTEYYASIDINEQIPSTSPNKALRKTMPFSTAGAMFGIKFTF